MAVPGRWWWCQAGMTCKHTHAYTSLSLRAILIRLHPTPTVPVAGETKGGSLVWTRVCVFVCVYYVLVSEGPIFSRCSYLSPLFVCRAVVLSLKCHWEVAPVNFSCSHWGHWGRRWRLGGGGVGEEIETEKKACRKIRRVDGRIWRETTSLREIEKLLQLQATHLNQTYYNDIW